MADKANESLRGEAAWKAAKERIAKKNEATYARGRRERAEENAEITRRRRAAERLDAANVPTQPHEHHT
jgi:hypothetical protein